LPPLSSPKNGPPQIIDWSLKDSLDTVIYILQEEDTESQSRRLKNQRILTTAYPQKSSENLSQRPIIHRPQRSQKASLLEFGCHHVHSRENHEVQAVDLYLDWSTLRALSLRLKILQARKIAPRFLGRTWEVGLDDWWLKKLLFIRLKASHAGQRTNGYCTPAFKVAGEESSSTAQLTKRITH
jgi:hypothetical protein